MVVAIPLCTSVVPRTHNTQHRERQETKTETETETETYTHVHTYIHIHVHVEMRQPDAFAPQTQGSSARPPLVAVERVMSSSNRRRATV